MNGQAPNNSEGGINPSTLGNVGTGNVGVGMDPTTLGNVGAPIENLETLESTPPVQYPQEKKEEIGQVPPEKKDNSKKPMNKILFILLIVALIAGVAYGVYYYLSLGNKKDDRVKTKEVSFAIGETLPTDVREYATFTELNPTNCSLDITNVDATKAGTYNYSITCGNDVYSGKITIKEGNLPEVVLKEVKIGIKGEVKPEDFIESCPDDCTAEFVNEEEILNLLNELGGPHEVEIKIISKSGGSIVKQGSLTVIAGYLECTSPAESMTDYKGNKTVVDSLAIGKGNLFVDEATRNYVYNFTDEAEYNQVKIEYKDANEFDKIVGKIGFDDVKHNLKVSVKIIGDTLTIEHGSEFPNEYIKIKTYYESKNYTCSFSSGKQ